jgi:hypothetical protein
MKRLNRGPRPCRRLRFRAGRRLRFQPRSGAALFESRIPFPSPRLSGLMTSPRRRHLRRPLHLAAGGHCGSSTRISGSSLSIPPSRRKSKWPFATPLCGAGEGAVCACKGAGDGNRVDPGPTLGRDFSNSPRNGTRLPSERRQAHFLHAHGEFMPALGLVR